MLIVILVLIGVAFYFIHQYMSEEHIQERYVDTVDQVKKKYTDTVRALSSLRTRTLPQTLLLKHLFYTGVPDRYDVNGRKIAGISPNAKKTLAILEESVQLGYVRGVLEIAQLYHHGLYGFPPNLAVAYKMYRTIMETTKDQELRRETLPFLLRIEDEMREKGILPHKQGNVPVEIWTHSAIEFQDANDLGNRGTIASLSQDSLPSYSTFKKKEKNPPEIVIRDDPHNVHDSGVLGTIKLSIDRLERSTAIRKPTDSVIREVCDFILTQGTGTDKQTDALDVLDAIEKNKSPHSRMNRTERDVLTLVWNRIDQLSGDDVRMQAKLNLFNELSESVEFDSAVCATGRFTRILDSLNVIDPAVIIKPTFAIRQEMMAKAARIREKLVSELSEPNRKFLDTPDPNSVQIEFESTLKKAIHQDLHNDYVATGIMTERDFIDETSQWIDAI